MQGAVLVHVHVADVEGILCFSVVKNLTISVLIVTSFMNRYVHGTFRSLQKPTLMREKPV